MTKILVVEDDRTLATVVESWLKYQHYVVDMAYTGAEGVELLDTYQYDCIVLDWGLPDAQGIDICKKFRARGGRTPVLMLTGKKEIEEKEEGLDSGADDYLTKPFDVKELAARIRALLRRPPTVYNPVLKCGDITLDTTKHAVAKGGEPIKLFPQEFALLECLLRYPDKIFSTEDLIERVWKSEAGASSETVRTSIKRLRKQIDTPDSPSLVENVHGVGYRLRQSAPNVVVEE